MTSSCRVYTDESGDEGLALFESDDAPTLSSVLGRKPQELNALPPELSSIPPELTLPVAKRNKA